MGRRPLPRVPSRDKALPTKTIDAARAGRFVVPTSVFRLILELEGHKAVRLQYGFSLLCLGFEAEGAEPNMLRAVTERCAALGVRHLRRTDTVTMLTPATLGILLIGSEASAVPRIMQRIATAWVVGPGVANVGRLGWSGGTASCPQDGFAPRALLWSAEQRMLRARAAGGNRVGLG